MSIAAICLALVLYHEARGEPLEGQLAVAEVVMNRAAAKQQPVCAVVAEAHQFATSRPDILPPQEPVAWQRARLIAQAVIDDPEGTLPRTGADHFHTVEVAPDWNKNMQPVAQIGAHLFFKDNT